MGDSKKLKKVNEFAVNNDIELLLESVNSFKTKCEHEALYSMNYIDLLR